MNLFRKLALIGAASMTLASCASSGPDMETVDYVDLERFMGDWYVIANIPTFLEKGAHNAVETYELNNDGTIATTFTFRDGGFDGKEKSYATPQQYPFARSRPHPPEVPSSIGGVCLAW